MNIVILESQVVNPGDLDWAVIQSLGNVTIYDSTTSEQLIERAKSADLLISNKCKINRSIIERLPRLKCVCLLSTGYDSIDVLAATEHGVTVCNAKGYSGHAVAQHVFALILELTNQVGNHSKDVHQGKWTEKEVWSYWDSPLVELYGKTLGVYGLGHIGTQVATIGLAFGMKVIATRKSNKPPENQNMTLVTETELFTQSDFLSLHAPLTQESKHVINKDTLRLMKSTSIIVNTGRGGLINEQDLRDALDNKSIRGAALDVLSSEPPSKNHILLGAPNCIITPHQAWASLESRGRLLDIVTDNIRAFQSGSPMNIVNAG